MPFCTSARRIHPCVSARGATAEDEKFQRDLDFLELEDPAAEASATDGEPAKFDHNLEGFQTQGLRCPHRGVKATDLSTRVLSIDLAGPYQLGFDNIRCMLVAAFRWNDGRLLQFMRGLRRRRWEGIFTAVQNVLAEVSALAGEEPQVVRIHSDRARVFLADKIVEGVNNLGINKTTTAGWTTEGGSVGIYDQGSSEGLLLAIDDGRSGRNQDTVLEIKPQGKLPSPGDTVAVTIHNPQPFEPKAEAGIYLAQARAVPHGALVLVQRCCQPKVTLMRLPALIESPHQTWRTHATPLGDLVWVSDSGKVRDAEAIPDVGLDLDILTME